MLGLQSVQFAGDAGRVSRGASLVEPGDDVVDQFDTGAAQPGMLVQEPDPDIVERWQSVIRAEDAHPRQQGVAGQRTYPQAV